MSMNLLLLVAKETFVRQVKSWTFLLLVFAPFIFLLVSVGMGMMMASQDSQSIALITQESSVNSAFAKEDGFETYASLDRAKKDLKNKDIEGYLVVERKAGRLEAVYYSEQPLDALPGNLIESTLNEVQQEDNLKESQLTDQQRAVFSQKAVLKEAISESKANKAIAKQILSFVLNFILYFLLLIYASSIAREVASEKGTKIMEVILSSVPASTYFYGRMLGVFGTVIVHLGTYLLGGGLLLTFLSKLSATQAIYEQVKPLLTSVVENLDWSLIFLVLFGLILYVAVAALCGSLVVRVEDVDKAIQPLMYLIIGGFIGAHTLANGGDGILLKVLSYLPFLSTFFMSVRVVNDYASSLEAVISIMILALSTGLTVYAIGKSYAGLILQTDDLGLLKSLKKGLMSK